MSEEQQEYIEPPRITVTTSADQTQAAIDSIPADETEAEDTEIEDDIDDDPEPEPEPKKRDAQARIRELANKNRELAERLEALEAAKYQPEQEQISAPQGKPDPSTYANGHLDPDYIDDLTDWKLEQKLAAREEAQAMTARQKAVADREAAFSAEHDDYEDAVARFLKTDVARSQQLVEAIADMDNAPALVYHLDSNPDDLKALRGLSFPQQLIKLGRIEASLSNEPQAKTTAKPVSKASAPITPVSGRGSVVDKSEKMEKALADGNYDAYKKAKYGR